MYAKKAYICLIGLPKLAATAPGFPLSITVENWSRPIWASGRGVTPPWNRASITNGREGRGEAVAVAETAGVTVNMKLVGELTGLSSGSGVAIISGDGKAEAASGVCVTGA